MRISPSTRRTVRLLAMAGLVGGLVLVWTTLPLQAWLTEAAETFRSFGAAGMVLFALLFVAAAMALVPASPFSLAAGLVYGAPGLGLAWLCMMFAGSVSFAVARHVFASSVRTVVARHRLADAALRVVDEEGWRMILLIRISGLVPFGLQNYGFAVSHISFTGFVAATAVGVLPGIMISAGLGMLSDAAVGSGWPDMIRVGGVGLAITAAIGVVALTVGKLRAKLAV